MKLYDAYSRVRLRACVQNCLTPPHWSWCFKRLITNERSVYTKERDENGRTRKNVHELHKDIYSAKISSRGQPRFFLFFPSLLRCSLIYIPMTWTFFLSLLKDARKKVKYNHEYWNPRTAWALLWFSSIRRGAFRAGPGFVLQSQIGWWSPQS